MEVKVNFTTEKKLQKFAAKLAKICAQEKTIIFLHGDLGAGKTTFARGFLRGLDYIGQVKSPTYTLVETYQTDLITVQHFDLYRLKDPAELEYLGIRDFFAEKIIALIEWPDCGVGFLPSADLICYLDFMPVGRSLCIKSNSAYGEKIIQQVKDGI